MIATITAFLASLLERLWKPLAIAGGFLLALGALLRRERQQGRQDSAYDALLQREKNRNTRDEIETENRSRPGTAAQRLRERWSRD